jgi:hypothetical protein
VSLGASPATWREGVFAMTMLMHNRDPFGRAPALREPRDPIRKRAAAAHRALIKRFCLGALTVLAAGAALAAVIALKVALFFWVYHYY